MEIIPGRARLSFSAFAEAHIDLAGDPVLDRTNSSYGASLFGLLVGLV
jgi:hypothetical protein